MISLLAIVTHICPPAGLVEDSILRTIREKHGPILSKIDNGEQGYHDLFSCPKFISVSSTTDHSNVYKLQMKQFHKEMEPQQAYRKLRSYMKLYTSIAVSKLAKFHDIDQVQDFLPWLISYKYRMLQLEAPEHDTFTTTTTDLPKKGALDIHYYLVNDMVHVDEAEKQRRFEKYFVGAITQNEEILNDAINLDTGI